MAIYNINTLKVGFKYFTLLIYFHLATWLPFDLFRTFDFEFCCLLMSVSSCSQLASCEEYCCVCQLHSHWNIPYLIFILFCLSFGPRKTWRRFCWHSPSSTHHSFLFQLRVWKMPVNNCDNKYLRLANLTPVHLFRTYFCTFAQNMTVFFPTLFARSSMFAMRILLSGWSCRHLW